MNEFLSNDYAQAIIGVLFILLSIVFLTIARLFNDKAKQISINTKNDNISYILTTVRDIAYSCVLSINQKYVNDLKNNNEFTDEKKKEVFNLAYNTIYCVVNKFLSEIIDKDSDKEEYINMLIEEAVASAKMSSNIKEEEFPTELEDLVSLNSFINDDIEYNYSSLDPKVEVNITSTNEISNND